jgi:hypothetical protein
VPIWLWVVVLGYVSMLAAAALWAVVERTGGAMAMRSRRPTGSELPSAEAVELEAA